MSEGLQLLVLPSRSADARRLANDVQRWEQLGVNGVLYPDHLFFENRAGSEAVACVECFVMAATVAALSETLAVGTIVANLALLHPALALRHFAQLAALYGGERVIAGIGAGWNTEEFAALGLEMPLHQARIERLREAAQLARALFDDGRATLEGKQFVARDFPLTPRPLSPPKLLIGGGSDAALNIAGLYADYLDLNGSSRRLPLGRSSPRVRDLKRRIATTVDDLIGSVATVRAVASQAQRSDDAVRFSILVGWIQPCADSAVDQLERELCRSTGVDPLPLRDCHYVLSGSSTRMVELLAERRERIGISSIIVPDGPHLDRLCAEVLPALA